jgi:hypothetical protein
MEVFHLRVRLLLAIITLCSSFFSACNFEMPRRIQASTSLDIHVPIGNIGEMEEVKEVLKYTTADTISELFSGTDAKGYYYTRDGDVVPLPDEEDPNKNSLTAAVNPGKVRSLLVHLPLIRLDMDFSEYLKADVAMPSVEIPGIPGFNPGMDLPPTVQNDLPPMTIPLGAMDKWVDWIDLNGAAEETTITLKGGKGLAGALEVAIPALGIGKTAADFKSGVSKGEDVVFAATEAVRLEPKTTEVVAYLRLIKVPPSGSYEVALDLKWNRAKVLPGEQGKYADSVSIPTEGLSAIFATYKAATIPCYLYVDGLEGSTGKAGLKAGQEWFIGTGPDFNDGEDIVSKGFPELYTGLGDGTFYDEALPGSTASFNLAKTLNNSDSGQGDLSLDYWIETTAWEVESAQTNGVITADIVVVMPLQFNVAPEPDAVQKIDGKEYISIFSVSDYGLGGTDLFGRDKIGSSLESLTSVRVSVQDMKNTIFAGELFLHIHDKQNFNELIRIKPGEPFVIDVEDAAHLPMPFNPVFDVYLEKKEPATVIKIEPRKKGVDDAFSAFVSVEATGTVEYGQDL